MFDLPEHKPLPRIYTCGHCQKVALNRASYNGVRLCAPTPEQNEAGVMDCYALVATQHHEMPCIWCQTGVPYGGDHEH